MRGEVRLDHLLNSQIYALVSRAIDELHPDQVFVPGQSQVPVTGKVFGEAELSAAVKASLDFWLTSGPYTEKFESRFAKIV